MYGILVDSVRAAIISSFGLDTWNLLSKELDMEGIEIETFGIYPDEVFIRVIDGK